MMRRVRRAGAVVVLFSMGLTNACYAYVPFEPGPDPATGEPGRMEMSGGSVARVRDASRVPIKAGDKLRIELTTDGTRELARYLGPGVRVVEGAATGVDSTGAIDLAVEFVDLRGGVKMPWTGEGVVRFPAAMQESVARHTFQKRQTIVASVVLAGALIAIAVTALAIGGAGGDDNPAPPPPPP